MISRLSAAMPLRRRQSLLSLLWNATFHLDHRIEAEYVCQSQPEMEEKLHQLHRLLIHATTISCQSDKPQSGLLHRAHCSDKFLSDLRRHSHYSDMPQSHLNVADSHQAQIEGGRMHRHRYQSMASRQAPPWRETASCRINNGHQSRLSKVIFQCARCFQSLIRICHSANKLIDHKVLCRLQRSYRT